MDARAGLQAACLCSLFALGSPAAWGAGAILPQYHPSEIHFGTHDLGTVTTPVQVRVDNPTSWYLSFAARSDQPDYVVDGSGCSGTAARCRHRPSAA
jgi:hypothetical protein